MFTARYALSLYIKQARFVLKGLILAKKGGKGLGSGAGCYPPGERSTSIHWIGDIVDPFASPDSKKKRKNLAPVWNQTTVPMLFYPQPSLCTHKIFPTPLSYSLAVSFVLQGMCFTGWSIFALIMLFLDCI